MFDDMTNPHNRELLTTLVKFNTLRNGDLDTVAPLTTRDGIYMRFELAKDLTKGLLLLGAIGWISKEARNNAATELVAFVDEARNAGNELGLDLAELPDAAKKLLAELN